MIRNPFINLTLVLGLLCMGCDQGVTAEDSNSGNGKEAKPAVREAVSPKVSERNLEQLQGETVKPWQPGDPVRVVEDLRSSEQSGEVQEAMPDNPKDPVVRDAVNPKSSDKDLSKEPALEPRSGDEPVRVVPDLRRDCDAETGDQAEDCHKDDDGDGEGADPD